MSESDLIESRRFHPPEGEDFWIFAYGSLMWRPDFPHRAIEPALLYGYHRAFCIRSIHYRGTSERPGVVLGLARGGSCMGRALLVAAEHGKEVADYLHDREMITGVYRPRWLDVRLGARGQGPLARAVAYVADAKHIEFCGGLGEEELARIIAGGTGTSGTNIDYLESTVRHLDQLGIRESGLHRLLRRIHRDVGAKP
ncbi:MAG: gamma-glutamylcyclotransferase [Dongiaceae bacterium]